MSKMPVIIDCNPRCINALGLALALTSDRLDVKGIVVPVYMQREGRALTNALKAVELLRSKTAVIRGAVTPLLGKPENMNFAEGNGIGFRSLPMPSSEASNRNYIDYCYQILMSSHANISIVAMGPLTDIGALLLAYPDAVTRIDRILIAGGTWIGGSDPQISSIASEENIKADPEAANIVFESGIPLVMFGDNMSAGLSFDTEQTEKIKTAGSVLSEFAFSIIKCHNAHKAKEPAQQSLFKSACPVAYLIDSSLFELRNYAVSVDLSGDYTRGCTIVDTRFETGRTKFVPTHTYVAVKADGKKLSELILKKLI